MMKNIAFLVINKFLIGMAAMIVYICINVRGCCGHLIMHKKIYIIIINVCINRGDKMQKVLEAGLGLLERRRIQAPELYLMPTSYCPNNCRYCYLNKRKIGLRDKLKWNNFLTNAYRILMELDFSKRGTICITGGELFCDSLLKDAEYVFNLKKLFKEVDKFIKGSSYRLAVPVGLENIGELGRKFIRWLKNEIPYVQILCAFTSEKFLGKEKAEIYCKNMEELFSYITALMCILIDKNDYHYVYNSGLMDKFVVNFDEPIQLDKDLAYSYGEIDWYLKPKEYKFSSPHCTAHKDITVTSEGFYTCGQISVKPSWVMDEEWERFCNDRIYLDEGYQQIIEWYGCDMCEKSDVCPGMCWISYYAQKYLFNNKKCIYK